MPDPTTKLPFGLVLAGGASRRMGGGDKTARLLAGRPLLSHVCARLAPQCCGLVVSSNEPIGDASLSYPHVTDALPGRPGPLAGILAGLDWLARDHPEADTLVSVAGDTPFLPNDLVIRLIEARAETADVVCAASGGRTHWTVAAWPASIREDLRTALTIGQVRRVEAFVGRYPHATVTWAEVPADPFFNVNTPEDLAEAEHLMHRLERAAS